MSADLTGKRLGSYEITALLGAGGMGEVWRARDAKLGREVALKVLPEAVTGDAEHRKRFEREARVLASLNHPHIAQVYGFEESGTVCALVMELVPGESLAERIARGPLPLREALELARQIAEGLEAAHEKGIVHRDLKPGNVQVTAEGSAKVLDFGLAKLVGRSGDLETMGRATTVVDGTEQGVVLGTPAYMSPEQARGLAVDARTDVWAFGAVLYEMLAGDRTFPGPSVSDLLAQILEREPDWKKLPATTSVSVRLLVQRCLRKEPRQRLHDIADARFVLEDALAALSAGASGAGFEAGGAGAVPAADPPRAVWRHPVTLGLAVVTVALASVLAWSLLRPSAAPLREPTFLSLMLPADQEMVLGGIDISPNGQEIVYSAVAEEGPPGPEGNVARLYHRRLSEPLSRPLPGTESGWAPMFSPDGEWVAFVSLADLKVKKLSLRGGGPVDLADAPWFTTGTSPGSWMREGGILLADVNGPVRRVSPAGGTPEIVVPVAAFEGGEFGTAAPRPLPSGAGILFATMPGSRLAVWMGGRRRTLLKQAVGARLFRGCLVFSRAAGDGQTDLCAVDFDARRAHVLGEPVALLSQGAGYPAWGLSDTGTLVHRVEGTGVRKRGFAWLARAEGFVPPPALEVGVGLSAPRLSPDGRRVLVGTQSGEEAPLLVADLESGAVRVVAAGSHYWAVWSADGRRAIYQEPGAAEGTFRLAWKPLDGSAPAERLTESRGWQQPQCVTRDGRFLIYQETGGLGAQTPFDKTFDLWLLPLRPRGEPRPLLRTEASEKLAHLSPDDRWMAYVSDESGRDEVWVRAFPDGAGAIQVSQDGGTEPLWAPDGRTLYYRDRTGSRLHAVPVAGGPVPEFGTPVVTVGNWAAASLYGRKYDVLPDGSALLLQPAQGLGRELRVILNFDELVRRKMEEAAR